MEIEQSLVENEIGGVILGSLQSALQASHLSEEQYVEEHRSNVPNKTEQGCRDRKLIYEEFERYRQWKLEEARYDLQDVVLELIKNGTTDELFGSSK